MVTEIIERPQIFIDFGATGRRKTFSLVTHCDKELYNRELIVKDSILLIVLEGVYELFYPKRTITLESNEMILLEKGTTVRINKRSSYKTSTCRCLYLFLCEDSMKTYDKTCSTTFTLNTANPKQGKYQLNNIISNVANITYNYLVRNELNYQSIVSQINIIFNEIYIYYHSLFKEMRRASCHTSVNWEDLVLMQTKYTFHEIAKQWDIDPDALRRRYKKQTGKLPGRDLLIKRMQKGQQLLRYSSMSISDIAKELQYSKYCSFSSAYKKYAGISPHQERMQWRKAHMDSEEKI